MSRNNTERGAERALFLYLVEKSQNGKIFAERRTAQNGRRRGPALGGSRPGQGGDGNGSRQPDTPAPARSIVIGAASLTVGGSFDGARAVHVTCPHTHETHIQPRNGGK